jgi:hypothetical protein
MSKSTDNTSRGRLLSLVVLLFVTGGYAGMLLGAQIVERAPVDIMVNGYATRTASYGWPMVHCFRVSYYLMPWGRATKANRRLTQVNDDWHPAYFAINISVCLLVTASVAFATWDVIRFTRFRRTFSIASLLIVTASVAGVFALDRAINIVATMQWDDPPLLLMDISTPFRFAVWIGLFCVAHVAIVTACDLAKLAGTRLYTIARRATTSTISAPHGEL